LFSSAHPPLSELYTLSLHDALPIFAHGPVPIHRRPSTSTVRIARRNDLPHTSKDSVAFSKSTAMRASSGSPRAVTSCSPPAGLRSEEHTSELQSHLNLVCRLLLEKK